MESFGGPACEAWSDLVGGEAVVDEGLDLLGGLADDAGWGSGGAVVEPFADEGLGVGSVRRSVSGGDGDWRGCGAGCCAPPLEPPRTRSVRVGSGRVGSGRGSGDALGDRRCDIRCESHCLSRCDIRCDTFLSNCPLAFLDLSASRSAAFFARHSCCLRRSASRLAFTSSDAGLYSAKSCICQPSPDLSMSPTAASSEMSLSVTRSAGSIWSGTRPSVSCCPDQAPMSVHAPMAWVEHRMNLGWNGIPSSTLNHMVVSLVSGEASPQVESVAALAGDVQAVPADVECAEDGALALVAVELPGQLLHEVVGAGRPSPRAWAARRRSGHVIVSPRAVRTVSQGQATGRAGSLVHSRHQMPLPRM